MLLRLLLSVAVLSACSQDSASQTPQPAPPAPRPPDRLYDYQVVKAYPHDKTAFTEGLFWLNGTMYESTGMVGRSFIRKVDLDTGKVLQERELKAPYFGEGIIAWGDKLMELTWQHNVGFIYDLKTFEPKGQFSYPGEGWAFTHDDTRIIMSDGTDELRFLDPTTLKETGRIKVTFNGQGLKNLNELEYIKGEVWANVWTTNVIVRIDPKTGYVVGRILLNNLLKPEDARGAQPDVLNGIAYDAAADKIYVTGKQWPKLYEIKVVERQRAPAQ